MLKPNSNIYTNHLIQLYINLSKIVSFNSACKQDVSLHLKRKSLVVLGLVIVMATVPTRCPIHIISKKKGPYYCCTLCAWHTSFSRDTIDLRPRSYTSAADHVMALQAHTEVTVAISTNAYENTLLRCCRVVFFPSSTLHLGGKLPFLLSSH